MRVFMRPPHVPEAVWRLHQRNHEVRCEIEDCDDGPAMTLFFDDRKLLSYQGVTRRDLMRLAHDERANLESRGWQLRADAN